MDGNINNIMYSTHVSPIWLKGQGDPNYGEPKHASQSCDHSKILSFHY